jgi:hypothetical protein
MIEIGIAKPSGKIYKRQLYGSWADVPVGELPFAFQQLMSSSDPNLIKVRLLKRWLKLPRAVFSRLDESQMQALVDMLDWVQLSPSATPLLPFFLHDGVQYHFPTAKFQNGVAMEYPIADDYFKAYIKSEKESDLLHLAATLCREAKLSDKEATRTGDIRIQVHSRGEISARATRFKNLNNTAKIAVFLYFAGIKSYIHQLYGSYLFDNATDDKKEEDGDEMPQKSDDGFGWWGMYMDIAESRVFGDYDKVLQTNFHTLCAYMVKKRKDYIKQQQQLNFNKPHANH